MMAGQTMGNDTMNTDVLFDADAEALQQQRELEDETEDDSSAQAFASFEPENMYSDAANGNPNGGQGETLGNVTSAPEASSSEPSAPEPETAMPVEERSISVSVKEETYLSFPRREDGHSLDRPRFEGPGFGISYADTSQESGQIRIRTAESSTVWALLHRFTEDPKAQNNRYLNPLNVARLLEAFDWNIDRAYQEIVESNYDLSDFGSTTVVPENARPETIDEISKNGEKEDVNSGARSNANVQGSEGEVRRYGSVSTEEDDFQEKSSRLPKGEFIRGPEYGFDLREDHEYHKDYYGLEDSDEEEIDQEAVEESNIKPRKNLAKRTERIGTMSPERLRRSLWYEEQRKSLQKEWDDMQKRSQARRADQIEPPRSNNNEVSHELGSGHNQVEDIKQEDIKQEDIKTEPDLEDVRPVDVRQEHVKQEHIEGRHIKQEPGMFTATAEDVKHKDLKQEDIKQEDMVENVKRKPGLHDVMPEDIKQEDMEDNVKQEPGLQEVRPENIVEQEDASEDIHQAPDPVDAGPAMIKQEAVEEDTNQESAEVNEEWKDVRREDIKQEAMEEDVLQDPDLVDEHAELDPEAEEDTTPRPTKSKAKRKTASSGASAKNKRKSVTQLGGEKKKVKKRKTSWGSRAWH